MGRGLRFGLIKRDMRESGKKIKLKGKESSYMQTWIYMKENSLEGKPMAMESIFKRRERCMKDCGWMINLMAKAN